MSDFDSIPTETFEPSYLRPPHKVRDRALLASLIESMRANGWQGRPLLGIKVSDGEAQLFTGSHRYAAAREAGIEVPVHLIDDAVYGAALEDGDDLLKIADDDQILPILEAHGATDAAALLRAEIEAVE